MQHAQTLKNPLGHEKIGKLMMKFAIPSIISMLVNSLYNIVDQIFVGQKIGYLGNAATNVIFPLTVVAIALSIMFGDGGAAFISLNLGKGDRKTASMGAGNSTIMNVLVGVCLTAVYLAFLPSICRLTGATDAVMPYALEYGYIIVLGLPFSTFAGGANAQIRADGKPKMSMLSMVAGAVTNLILDPIFIFGFEWGMAGAAWATVIGQVLSAVISFICIRRYKSIKLTKDTLKLRGGVIRRVMALGVSSFITQIAIVAVIITCNLLLTRYGAQSPYGAEIPLAAHGITMKVNQIMMSVCLGLAAGCQPIMGFNYGAEQYARVRQTILRCVLIATAVMAVATAIYQLFPMAVVGLFGQETELYNQFAVMDLQIFLRFCIFSGLQICSGIFFQAIGKPVQAAVISLTRQIVFIIPAMIILSSFMGVEGVLWAGPTADIAAFVLSFTLVLREVRNLRKLEAGKGRPLPAAG